MKAAAFFLFVVLSINATGAELGFVPKPTGEDKPIGDKYSQPVLKFGGKALPNVPIVLAKTGGVSLWANNSIKPLDLNAETGAVTLGGKELSKKDPTQKRALKSLAWYLVQRYPKQAFTTKFLGKYFEVTPPWAMTNEQKAGLNRSVASTGSNDKGGPKFKLKFDHSGGLGAGGLPFEEARAIDSSSAQEPSYEQLNAFYEDPTDWVAGGVCTAKGCQIEHKPGAGEPALGQMLASQGMKDLMVGEEDFAPATPAKSTVSTSSEWVPAKPEPVSDEADFNAKFGGEKEQEAWVLFTATDCGPCHQLRNRIKSIPKGVRIYVHNSPTYRSFDSFKGQGAYPQVVKFTKSEDGSLARTPVGPGGETGRLFP